MSIVDRLPAYESLRDEIRKGSVTRTFMLVDLANSTAFKTKHPEGDWLIRLRTFHQTVLDICEGIGPAKLLGDGVLVHTENAEFPPQAVLEVARKILNALGAKNRETLPGEHAIIVRIILNHGSAFVFENDDPQGTAVDKLFRMEKFVPDGCIGVTEEFAIEANIKDPIVGRFPLKGLPHPEFHSLILVPPLPSQTILAALKTKSLAASLWWLPGFEIESVNLVGGIIPSSEFYSVHVGDMNAKLNTFQTLVSLGYGDNISNCDSSEFQDRAFGQNVVSVGGPCYNHITRRLMDGLPIAFENIDSEDDDETPLIDNSCNKRFCAIKRGKNLVRDFGVFIRRRNPSNPDRRVIIACGIESPAVDGIVRAFSPNHNTEFRGLMERVAALGPGPDGDPLPEFYCVMEFHVEPNRRVQLPPLREQVAHIFSITSFDQ